MSLQKLKIIDVHNYEDIYQLSENGEVFRINKKGKRKCKPFLANGYLCVALSKNNIRKQFTLHRLLAIHFIPNPENKPTVNHIDGDKLNNYLENLEWATHSEQIKHAISLGLYTPKPIKCIYTEELREVRRKARKGTKLKTETKNKISQSLSKGVISEDGLKFNSIKAAAAYENIPKTTFHRKLIKSEKINDRVYKMV